MFKFIRTTAAVAAALAAFTGAGAAQDSFKVSSAGLDLGSPAGAAAFAGRSDRAARRFCTTDWTLHPDRDCVRLARQAASEQLPAQLRARLAGTRTPPAVLASR